MHTLPPGAPVGHAVPMATLLPLGALSVFELES
jgi:hypothetical protein